MHYFKNILRLTLLLIVPLFIGCDDTDKEYYHTITFEKKTTMPGTGRASAVAFAVNGKGYVTLGRGPKKLDLWEYNPVTDSWTEKAPFPGKNRVKAVAAVVNNKAYVGLGFLAYGGALSQSSYLSDFWCYDPATNEWESMAGFPGGDTDGSVCFVMNNIIYVGSGYSYLSARRYFWAYEPTENRWRTLAEFTGPARFGVMGCSDGKRAFFGSGFNGGNLNDWWEYTTSTDTWKKRKSMPDKGRVNGIALAVNNRFFAITGRYFNGKYNGGTVLNSVVEYDAENNKWHNRGKMPDGGRDNAVSFIIDNKAYIGFGENDEGMMNDMYCFEP